ncbi:hypothetical protein [Pseudomonas simiae]|uniref:hypothetical protein n=1 Tax=Pseudomonas simiae TaxID=321846 RepID=UPI0020958546|nr:hypothetical protein [Pseudomonas simiae]
MISLIQLPILAVCSALLLDMRRFWICIYRMGSLREVGRRAPALLLGDILVASLTFLPFLIAAIDWFGIPLPYQEGPVSPKIAAVLSVGCLGGALLVLRDSGNRFAGHWAGTREGALRTVAALRIIDAAELAYALDFAQQREARHGSNRRVAIDVEEQEVRK